MSEYEFKIHLQQYTPILHFQGNYAGSGATLRVTELKPKLDRYIKANYEIKREWKICNTDALNYKLKVVDGDGETASCSNIPMYFAEPKKSPNDANYSKKPTLAIAKDTQGDENAIKFSITLEFFCLNKELAHLLKGLDYTVFFLATNFGTRQSKGYGSFSPKTTTNTLVPTNMVGKEIKTRKEKDEYTIYRVDSFFISQSHTWDEVMNEISDVYKCLRSGINEGGLYFKSLMFAYAKSKGQWWDKRVIKELFFPKKLEEQRNKHINRTEPDPLAEQPRVTPNNRLYPMFRDNLGLATDEFWKEYDFKVKKKGSAGILRFKSPILFKPLRIKSQWYIFILHCEIPRGFRDATFKILKDDTPLRFQTYNGFSMKAFLNYVFTIDDYKKYLSKNNDSKRSNTILENLEKIKNNFKPIQ